MREFPESDTILGKSCDSQGVRNYGDAAIWTKFAPKIDSDRTVIISIVCKQLQIGVRTSHTEDT